MDPNLRASENVRKGDCGECWIAASRTDANILIGMSHAMDSLDNTGLLQCTTLLSRNGGQTWHKALFPKQESACFDPIGLETNILIF